MTFTDTAADTQFAQYIWPLQNHHFAILRWYADFFQPDGFFRGWAHLLADDAGSGRCPRETAIAVDHGGTDDSLALLLKRQGWDGAGRADLSTGVTTVIAMTE